MTPEGFIVGHFRPFSDFAASTNELKKTHQARIEKKNESSRYRAMMQIYDSDKNESVAALEYFSKNVRRVRDVSKRDRLVGRTRRPLQQAPRVHIFFRDVQYTTLANNKIIFAGERGSADRTRPVTVVIIVFAIRAPGFFFFFALTENELCRKRKVSKRIFAKTARAFATLLHRPHRAKATETTGLDKVCRNRARKTHAYDLRRIVESVIFNERSNRLSKNDIQPIRQDRRYRFDV